MGEARNGREDREASVGVMVVVGWLSSWLGVKAKGRVGCWEDLYVRESAWARGGLAWACACRTHQRIILVAQ